MAFARPRGGGAEKTAKDQTVEDQQEETQEAEADVSRQLLRTQGLFDLFLEGELGLTDALLGLGKYHRSLTAGRRLSYDDMTEVDAHERTTPVPLHERQLAWCVCKVLGVRSFSRKRTPLTEIDFFHCVAVFGLRVDVLVAQAVLQTLLTKLRDFAHEGGSKYARDAAEVEAEALGPVAGRAWERLSGMNLPTDPAVTRLLDRWAAENHWDLLEGIRP